MPPTPPHPSLLIPPSSAASSHSSHSPSSSSSSSSQHLSQRIARQVHSQARLLRGITILTFLPAFPLLIAHGVLSKSLVPAIGLVPLFISAVVGLFLISKYRAKDRRQNQLQNTTTVEVVGGRGVYSDDDVLQNHPPDESAGWEGNREDEDEEDETIRESVFTHRILVFLTDAALTVGFAVVLGFTWVKTEMMNGDAILAMLAAYGTIPLLVNFLIHLYLTVREFIAGLALHGLVQYAAWHVLPPDCPDCGSRLRPEAHPPIPWYESVSRPKLKLKLNLSAPSLPTLPKASLPSIKVPAWLKRGGSQSAAAAAVGGEDASLFVDDEQIQRDRYRDDPEEASSTADDNVIATGAIGSGSVVEEVIIVAKKDKKKRSISGSSPMYGEDDSSWA
ncbi:hypothetical protein QBC44DRAFT_276709 [Cladorrhinum sp. PSN332]|nr:hypothetical protein QBC44DRAFT_276709 [Cladorrhinum sp. PSN332]